VPTVAEYTYLDKNGTVCGKVERVEPGREGRRKEFFPHHFDGSKFVLGLNGKQFPLYHADEVAQAIADGQTIFFVEGEGKADALCAALQATKSRAAVTTIAGGCKAPLRDEHLAALNGGAKIVFLVDSDEPGRASAKARADVIARRYPQTDVRIIDLFADRDDGSDVADWLREGHKLRELAVIIADAPRVEAAPTRGSVVARTEPEWEPAYPWPTLDAAALHGLAGDIIRAIAPETEADPAAMLITLLSIVGNVLGADACARVGDQRHPGRLFVAIVGDTSAGAKGMSEAAIRPIVRAAFPEWFDTRRFAGFGSGEAIVAEYVDEATDRRGFIFEPEYARVLTVAGRDGSTLSPIFREAWDGGTLAVRRAKERIVARDVHLSVVAHITPSELRTKLAEGDVLNGFANRFVFVASRRSKKLPSGGHVDPSVIGQLAKRLSSVIRPTHKTYARSPEAETLWTQLYMAEPDRDGAVGSLTARAHAQRLRLSVLYAALDGANDIRPEHLRAGDACWRYAVQSVEHIFGSLRGDRIQDRLLDALRKAWPRGLTGAEQDAIFSKNLRPGQLAEARVQLETRGLIRTENEGAGAGKGGRSTVRSYAVPPTEQTEQTEQPTSLRVNPSNPFNPSPVERDQREPALVSPVDSQSQSRHVMGDATVTRLDFSGQSSQSRHSHAYTMADATEATGDDGGVEL
jgi:hypothetical protein